ncbi:YDG/SRA domain-containing protein [Streptomyces halobius]|uniref:YDG/SRA domain-containing protein n=1 Tax=Streptomyces halobius TaxID=2879846 RepID=A0ABY4MMI3_9ACTN|nr:YDG/SRA domain-containing protein [Streptomyces halobius]
MHVQGSCGTAQAGIHRGYGQGISGTAHEGVASIVLSGGYVDDVYGDSKIIYGRGHPRQDTGASMATRAVLTR